MSQSASFSPFSPSHSDTLLTISGCRRPGVFSHSFRNWKQRGSDSLKKYCSDGFRIGVEPVNTEYGLISSVGW